MEQSKEQLRDELLKEITSSKMTFKRKIKVMKLLDKAFRNYLGIICLSDQEIEDMDILNRSM